MREQYMNGRLGGAERASNREREEEGERNGMREETECE